MNRLRLLCSAICLLAFTVVAHADNADLAWNHCAGVLGASDVKNFACDDNDTQINLAPTFTLDYDLTNFAGVQVDIDVITDGATLPDWWRFQGGECRDNDAFYSPFISGVADGTTCKKPWGSGAATGSTISFTTPVGSQANRLTIHCNSAQSPHSTVLGGQRYLAGVLELFTAHAYDDGLGGGVCAGCQTAACLVLDRVAIYTDGPGNNLYSTIYPTTNFLLTYNKAAGAPCVTASKRNTWGTVKALYR